MLWQQVCIRLAHSELQEGGFNVALFHMTGNSRWHFCTLPPPGRGEDACLNKKEIKMDAGRAAVQVHHVCVSVLRGWRMTGSKFLAFYLRDACLVWGGCAAGGCVVSDFIELIKVESCLLFPLESLCWPWYHCVGAADGLGACGSYLDVVTPPTKILKKSLCSLLLSPASGAVGQCEAMWSLFARGIAEKRAPLYLMLYENVPELSKRLSSSQTKVVAFFPFNLENLKGPFPMCFEWIF